MLCYKCGESTIGDNLQCEDCREELNKCEDCGHTRCICYEDFDDEIDECDVCFLRNGEHRYGCPNDNSPYGNLLKYGYD